MVVLRDAYRVLYYIIYIVYVHEHTVYLQFTTSKPLLQPPPSDALHTYIDTPVDSPVPSTNQASPVFSQSRRHAPAPRPKTEFPSSPAFICIEKKTGKLTSTAVARQPWVGKRVRPPLIGPCGMDGPGKARERKERCGAWRRQWVWVSMGGRGGVKNLFMYVCI